MYKIGELSCICRMSVKTLRYYADIGLLVPDEIDKFTGYRYYSAAKIDECNRITLLKELGFSLEEIKVQFVSDNKNICSLIEAKKSELEVQKQNITLQLKKLESVKAIFRSEQFMRYITPMEQLN